MSKLADMAHAGETVVIAKAGKPCVDVVPHVAKKERIPGGYKIDMDDFESCDKEIEALFEGQNTE